MNTLLSNVSLPDNNPPSGLGIIRIALALCLSSCAVSNQKMIESKGAYMYGGHIDRLLALQVVNITQSKSPGGVIIAPIAERVLLKVTKKNTDDESTQIDTGPKGVFNINF